MKIIPLIVFSLSLYSQSEKNYIMDKKYFSLKYPSNMIIEREKEKDYKNNIYKVVFKEKDTNTIITVKYYHPKSNKDYKTFIETQSSSDGNMKTPTEEYEEVKNIKLGEKKAFEINRKMKEYESLNTNLSYWLKEKIIVIPVKKGFYVISFSAREEQFEKKLKMFDIVLKSFKTLY